MVSGFPCGVFIFQRVYLFPAFSAVLAEHTHTVCPVQVMYRAL